MWVEYTAWSYDVRGHQASGASLPAGMIAATSDIDVRTALRAGQLLRHVLGLATETGKRPRLLVLWDDNRCVEPKAHLKELVRFASLIDDSVEFKET